MIYIYIYIRYYYFKSWLSLRRKWVWYMEWPHGVTAQAYQSKSASVQTQGSDSIAPAYFPCIHLRSDFRFLYILFAPMMHASPCKETKDPRQLGTKLGPSPLHIKTLGERYPSLSVIWTQVACFVLTAFYFFFFFFNSILLLMSRTPV